MSANPLTAVVVGAGHRAVVYSSYAHWHPEELRIVGVADPDGFRRNQFAESHDIPSERRYRTAEDLAAAGQFADFAINGTMDPQHVPTSLPLLDAGYHLLLEKPFATSEDEAWQLVHAARRNARTVGICHVLRFAPFYAAVRARVAEGAIGEVCQAAMQKSYRLGERPEWQRSRETFSGIIPFVGIHALDLIRWVTGRDFTQGAAWCSNVGHPAMRDLEDNACVALQLDNGASASARLDYCRPAKAPTHGDDRLRVAGNEGVIEWMYTADQLTLLTNSEEPRVVELDEPIDQFANFVSSFYEGTPSWVPAEDCIRMTEICLRLRDARISASI